MVEWTFVGGSSWELTAQTSSRRQRAHRGGGKFLKSQSLPWYSFNRATPPNAFQIVPVTWDHAFKQEPAGAILIQTITLTKGCIFWMWHLLPFGVNWHPSGPGPSCKVRDWSRNSEFKAIMSYIVRSWDPVLSHPSPSKDCLGVSEPRTAAFPLGIIQFIHRDSSLPQS